MLESQACDSINNLRVSGPSSPQKLMRWLVGGLPRAGRGREARQTGRRRTPPLASRARTKCLSPSTASGDSPGAFRTGCWSSQIRDVRQPGSKQIPGQPREPIPMPAKFADYTPFEQPAGPAVFPLSNTKMVARLAIARSPCCAQSGPDLQVWLRVWTIWSTWSPLKPWVSSSPGGWSCWRRLWKKTSGTPCDDPVAPRRLHRSRLVGSPLQRQLLSTDPSTALVPFL
mmetsp:Transcript_18884/g.28388  ORF Transcript_18884/g.28388 Transcript_18884/m.28388 type:complete len:228 (-) Transcript_18884:51-734(-)